MSYLEDTIVDFLASRPDLRQARYNQPGAHPLSGHCYVAAEALWHLLYGPEGDYPLKPEWTRLPDGGTHWYLRWPNGEVEDLTRDQFDFIPDYDHGHPCGFLTRAPSKRAQVVIDYVNRLDEAAIDNPEEDEDD